MSAETTVPQLEASLDRAWAKAEQHRTHAQKAANIIAELLASTLMQAEKDGRKLYVWERDGIEWLREQWKRDPATTINMWTADRYVKPVHQQQPSSPAPPQDTKG